MNCLDCGVSIDTNHKRCEPCRKAIKRAKNKRDAQREREKRHERGLKHTNDKGGHAVRVNAQCMRCKSDIEAAANRRDTTLCQSCRDDANRDKSSALWRKRHPKPIMMSGATCSICQSPFVRGLCECRE